MCLIEWWVDAAFVLHNDYKSHSSESMMKDKGLVIHNSKKQKISRRSLTNAEVVGANYIVPSAILANLVIQAQKHMTKTVLYQDNQVAMKLETISKSFSGQRMRHLNICCFFIKNQVD